jgi:flagellar protein FliS
MSYDAARNYRVQAAEFASPVGVIVQAYDQITRALNQAARALESGDIELKTREVDRALMITTHLEDMLDHEAGPEVANKLAVFYETMRYQMVKASAQTSGDSLREVGTYFTTMRETWQTVEREHPTLPAGAAPAPRRSVPSSSVTDFPADRVASNWSA